uniref:BPTI/Kunitz inhibitor domain-containing protein n=1 Tax=Ditylenchus dipsaci TaxID=166011 RepID=A0A915D1X8_9BILA
MRKFCSKLVCEHGNPLRIGEDWQRCETSNDCPNSHQCESAHKVCCPTAQSICTQPKRLGDCTSSVRRYWYNAGTRACELFQYTGCQGNDNNFDSLLDCQQKCRNVALEPKCPQGKAHRDTNSNFFKCSTKSEEKNCPPNFQCAFDGTSYGWCGWMPERWTASARYSYKPIHSMCEASSCPNTHECVGINFNGNVAHTCCPTKAHICSLPPQQGNLCTKTPVTKWYFNIVTKECGKFSFNGCNGNLNNFASLEQCTNFCSSSACAPGEITFKDVNSKGLMYCSPSLLDSCPLDYKCKYDSLTSKNVCCGTPISDVCPQGEKTYVNAIDESVKECAINQAGSCPSDFLCRFSNLHNRYYCCASRSGNMCPEGRALYRNPNSLQPTQCSVNGPQQTCVEGFSCQSRFSDVLQGYCCSSQDVCKNGAEFLTDEKTQMPKICMQGAFSSCDEGYRCYKPASSTSGYCCKGEGTVNTGGCPPGEYAFTKKDEIVQCDPFNLQDKGCPPKYSCQYTLTYNRYQCCGKEPVEEEEVLVTDHGCLSGQVAYIQNGAAEPQLCTSSAPNSCPLGFFCQFSDKNSQFQCCAHKAGCPADTVAYVDLSGNPQTCKMGKPTITQCPLGYSCRETSTDKTICCTIEGVDKFTTRWSNETISITGSPKLIETETTTPVTKPDQNKKGAPVPTDEIDEKVEGMEKKTHEIVQSIKANAKLLCKANEILVDGVCKPRQIGESCITNRHCPATSVCTEYTCKCPSGTVHKGNKCVKKPTEIDDDSSEQPDSKEIDPDVKLNKKSGGMGSGSLGGRGRGSSTATIAQVIERIKTAKPKKPAVKCQPDEILFNGTCIMKNVSIGATCVISAQCRNGAKCVNRKCRCPSAANNAVKCSQSPSLCEYPHRCSFSKVMHDYICCRSANSIAATIHTGTIHVNGNKRNRTKSGNKESTSEKSSSLIGNSGSKPKSTMQILVIDEKTDKESAAEKEVIIQKPMLLSNSSRRPTESGNENSEMKRRKAESKPNCNIDLKGQKVHGWEQAIDVSWYWFSSQVHDSDQLSNRLFLHQEYVLRAQKKSNFYYGSDDQQKSTPLWSATPSSYHLAWNVFMESNL